MPRPLLLLLGAVLVAAALGACATGAGAPDPGLLSAAEAGDADAQVQLAAWYQESVLICPGGDCAANREAFRWLTLAAEQDNADALYDLSFFYFGGKAVEADNERAFALLSRAAAQGHAPSQYTIGMYHAQGWGTPFDPVMAYAWFRLAEDGGVAGEPIPGREWLLANVELSAEEIAEAEAFVAAFEPAAQSLAD